MAAQMSILLVGRGGRESALAHKLSQSNQVAKIFVAPGNGGTAQGIPKVSNIDADEEDFHGLVALAKKLDIGLVVPGPDAHIVNGIEGYFREAGIPCFAPTKEAAQLEGSKAFSKDFMAAHNIPTAEYRNFTDFERAGDYVNSVNHKVVIKASGLAAGKGVIIPESKEETLKAIHSIMVDRDFGDAGSEIVIEEFLEGDEMSILTFSDGLTFKSMPPAQDHKRIFDGDQGPNTGGMGCYAPTKIASPEIIKQIDDLILRPTLEGMRKNGTPFVGMLFTGIMLTKSGPKTLEYNARFGDPETQTLLPLLESDLATIMKACIERRLSEVEITMSDRSSAVVVVSSGGYPGKISKATKFRWTTGIVYQMMQGLSLSSMLEHLFFQMGHCIPLEAASLQSRVLEARWKRL
ncbi:related to bifunctional purine biosynthetic protein [Rhynchosporium agropyri]|uniref:phosphoribosylamine--glycine ligase n=1 Tax=Rhynchosporium agropyri TaxID=914238 RepID=A0A1E1JRZ1_9HELO|nr:related to bifunctional purine biosynthetic protein [Rhynchosporium agropyri]